jgi:hypothetical protein
VALFIPENCLVATDGQAFSNATIDEIQANAKATVQSGHSAGSWSIEPQPHCVDNPLAGDCTL